MSCSLWVNIKARIRSSIWWVQDFAQDKNFVCDQKNYICNDKAQDYRDMISRIFQEMKQINNSGGMKLKLDFDKGRKHEVISIPVIQFSIGD